MTTPPGAFDGELGSLESLEGEHDPRVATLLWLARAYYGQDELESYAGVFTSSVPLNTVPGARIDGLVNYQSGDELQHVLLVWVGHLERVRQVDAGLALADALRDRPEDVERELAHGAVTSHLLTEMRPLRRAAKSHAWRLTLVSDRRWTSTERRRLEAGGVDRWDVDQLNELAAARTDPSWMEATTVVSVAESERLLTRAGERRVFVAPVRGEVIAAWPGIESRRLFDLNVRFGLGARNRVRQSLDTALTTQDQDEFIASHNGLTVVCEHVDPSPTSLTIRNFSVVNGAQSVIALHANITSLDPSLKVLVKFVEVGPDDDLATEIAVRSNTQNPVTGRNLRALDDSQIRLRQELASRGYVFDTRPDTSRRAGEREIRNDDAAQWICAIYLERPWLAVKRTLLFAPETFQEIFAPSVSAEHIILLNTLRREIDALRQDFPDDLRRAWLLTALTAIYLSGQMMRSNDSDRALLLSPPHGSGDSNATTERLRTIASRVRTFLVNRHDQALSDFGYDNFRIEFKRQRTLLEMSSEIIRETRTRAREDGE